MPTKRAWFLVWFASVLPLLGWWSYGLFDLDEGFYGAITAEMNRRNEWITPFYNGEPWFEKPILLYWLAKPSMMLFGPTVGPRLPSVLATIGTIALIAWFLRRHVSERAAQIGVLAYGTCLLPVAAGRMMLTDPILVLCLVGTFLTFWESLVGDRRWRVLSAALLGFSVLAKGPVGCALFVLVAGFVYWRIESVRESFKGWWPTGTIVFLAVVASWYLPAYLVHRQVFVQKFLIEQNLNRFTGGDAAHTVPPPFGWLFYIPILFLGALPWSIWALKPLFGRGRSHPAPPPDEPRHPAPDAYLAICFWVVFAFFTISGAKLPHYVLPCVAPLAMLASIRLDALMGSSGVLVAEGARVLGPRRKLLIGGVLWSVVLWAFAQWAFTGYYYGTTVFGRRIPGFHAEIHRLGRYVARQERPGEAVAVYRMGRREKDLGTGKPKIQETSHPSLLMVMNQNLLETDDFRRILAERRPTWIVTRWNRIGPEERSEAAAAGRPMERVRTPFVQDMYALWKIGG